MASTVAISMALRVQELSAGYGTHRVLSSLSLEIAPGQWFALLGPNGAGKTTLLHCIAGLLAPQSGQIAVSGIAVQGRALEAKRLLGFGCAPERLPDLLTGRQCLQIHAAAKQLRGLDEPTAGLMRAFQFEPLLDHFVDTYSTGSRQKLAVLLALLGEPALIVLDEAFNGLDPGSSLALKRHLRERVAGGLTSVLLATHALDVVERYADQAALLLAGRLVHTWQARELAALRGSPQGLEGAVADVATTATAAATAAAAAAAAAAGATATPS
jgi:ABC-2 type transport system ATP-binding protein